MSVVLEILVFQKDEIFVTMFSSQLTDLFSSIYPEFSMYVCMDIHAYVYIYTYILRK